MTPTTRRSGLQQRPSTLTRYVRSCNAERVKTFSTRSWWLIGLIMVLYIAFTAGLIALALSGVLDPGQPVPPDGAAAPLVYSMGLSLGYIFPVLLGALSVTGEYRHDTMAGSFLSVGSRGPVLLGKVTVQAAMGALYGVAAIGATLLASLLLFFHPDHSTMLDAASTWTMFLRIVVSMALWAVIGVGLGALVRSQAAAIVIVLVFTQFLEPTLRMLGGLNESAGAVVKFLPGSVSDAFAGQSFYDMVADGATSPLTWWVGGLVLAGYAVVLLAAAWLLRWQGDIQ